MKNYTEEQLVEMSFKRKYLVAYCTGEGMMTPQIISRLIEAEEADAPNDAMYCDNQGVWIEPSVADMKKFAGFLETMHEQQYQKPAWIDHLPSGEWGVSTSRYSSGLFGDHDGFDVTVKLDSDSNPSRVGNFTLNNAVGIPDKRRKATAKLLVDAGNVFNETSMIPSEVNEQRVMLVDALQKIEELSVNLPKGTAKGSPTDNVLSSIWQLANEALNK